MTTMGRPADDDAAGPPAAVAEPLRALDAASGPTVTIVIPTYQEELHIGACLDAVLAQDHPGVVQILVVDGRSSDRTRELAAARTGVTVLDNPRRIQAAALNVALAHARGEIFVRIDAHSTVAPDYVSTAVEALQRTGAAVVGGPMRPVATGARQRGIAAAMASPVGAGPARFHREGASGWVDTVWVGVFRTALLRAVGGYREDVGVNEDAELAHRMAPHGGVWLEQGMRSTYTPRSSLRAVARQFHRYGRSRAATVKLHPSSLSPRQLVAPALVAGLLLPGRRYVAAAYALALSGAAARHARHDAPSTPWFVGSLVSMHVPWGTGFLRGLVRGAPTTPASASPPDAPPLARAAWDGAGAVDVVIVAYRSGVRLARALQALAGEPGIGRVVVVDHGDGADAALARELGAEVVHRPDNPGYGSGQNVGVARCTAPFVLLLNPDAELEPGALVAGRLTLEARPDVAAVQGVVRRAHDGQAERTQGAALGPVHLWGRALHLRALLGLRVVRVAARRVGVLADHVDRTTCTEREVESLAAVSILVRREAFCSVGGFDERYFLYGEDLDLCHRLRADGWALLTLPQAWAVHVGGASAGSSTERELTWWRGTMRYAASWWPDRAWRWGLRAAMVRWARLAASDPRRALAAWHALVGAPRNDRAALRSGEIAPWIGTDRAPDQTTTPAGERAVTASVAAAATP
jgi:succinoglycan biosynthesis protein ExoA